ncbi:Flp family type IVb pilin [Devosia submarina]|uniref:Flp family type IVb pilin n=1 Tax=Devosia submarina TaxID=1173082 RepID=UPI000D391BD4|nr:Flp family type IVb pilin [Devosia submarina]
MLMAFIQAFIDDESGATAIEYGLIAMLTCLLAIASFTLVGEAVVKLFDNGTAEVIAEQTSKIPS